MPEKTETYYVVQLVKEFFASTDTFTHIAAHAYYFVSEDLATKVSAYYPGSVVRTLTLTVT